VLEMNKANEYSVGKQLKIGKATYTDLDELIVNHVEAMARKVAELTRDERFQHGTKEETGNITLPITYPTSPLTSYRAMARELLHCERKPLHLRLLQHAQTPRLLLDLLPDGQEQAQGRVGHQSGAQRLRAAQTRVS
jgi:hypothetical protein